MGKCSIVRSLTELRTENEKVASWYCSCGFAISIVSWECNEVKSHNYSERAGAVKWGKGTRKSNLDEHFSLNTRRHRGWGVDAASPWGFSQITHVKRADHDETFSTLELINFTHTYSDNCMTLTQMTLLVTYFVSPCLAGIPVRRMSARISRAFVAFVVSSVHPPPSPVMPSKDTKWPVPVRVNRNIFNYVMQNI